MFCLVRDIRKCLLVQPVLTLKNTHTHKSPSLHPWSTANLRYPALFLANCPDLSGIPIHRANHKAPIQLLNPEWCTHSHIYHSIFIRHFAGTFPACFFTSHGFFHPFSPLKSMEHSWKSLKIIFFPLKSLRSTISPNVSLTFRSSKPGTQRCRSSPMAPVQLPVAPPRRGVETRR